MPGFSENIMTLASAGYDVRKITTPAYAQRLASGVRKAEQAGRAAPTRTALRGHARAPVTFLPKSGHQLAQHQMMQPTSMADLRNLLKRAKKPTGGDRLVVISGVVSKYPHETPGETGIPKTISVWLRASSLKATADRERDGQLPELIAWANTALAGCEWISIASISIAYPAEKES